MSTAKKVLFGVLLAILVVALAVVIYLTVMLNRINYVSDEEAAARVAQQQLDAQNATPKPEGAQEEEEPDLESELNLADEVEQTQLTPEEEEKLRQAEQQANVTNILLIGVDRRGTNGYSRSDTMLIATVDRNNNLLKLTSLMRDMYVPIPGNGENRINSANAKGGPLLLMQTINENFSLNITNYVMVDFSMFEKIIDKLGGVTIEMSAGEVSEANDCIAGLNLQRGKSRTDGLIKKKSGSIKLTGKQALGYSRIRHFGNGDYARTSRQFKVLKEIYTEFMKADVIQMHNVAYDLLPLIETNITSDDILSLMVSVVGMGVDPDNLLHFRIPADGMYQSRTVKGMSVLLPDIPKNTVALHDFLYSATVQPEMSGTNTGAGTYHPKPYYDENGNYIDPSATPSPSPSPDPEEELIPEETLLPEESGEPEIILPGGEEDEEDDIIIGEDEEDDGSDITRITVG